VGLSLIHHAIAGVGLDAYSEWWETLSPAQRWAIARTWRLNARPEQLLPGEPGSFSARRDWRTWLVLAGRGFGKSRTGAEAVTAMVDQGRARMIALIAPTLAKARQYMIEHPDSGLLAVATAGNEPEWYPGNKEIVWPNGARALVYTSEEPDDVRGFSGDFAWGDELGAWKYPDETWANLQFGLRKKGPKGDPARAVVTTTPRPLPLLRELVTDPGTVKSTGSTYENSANLDPGALAYFLRKYEGTRRGRQELKAEILADTPGALWTNALIEENRVRHAPPLKRVVVAIDPATKDVEAARKKDEEYEGSLTGIVTAGLGPCRCRCRSPAEDPELHGFILDDASGIYTPKEWAEVAVAQLEKWGADKVIGEVNNGGALVEANLRAYGYERLPYKAVTASRGKQTRAEPVASLDEQHRTHHVGVFAELEDEMTTWQPLIAKKSPDRMDARVWAVTELMLGSRGADPPPKRRPVLPRRI
jgi:phage terminase large subunit-like protein